MDKCNPFSICHRQGDSWKISFAGFVEAHRGQALVAFPEAMEAGFNIARSCWQFCQMLTFTCVKVIGPVRTGAESSPAEGL